MKKTLSIAILASAVFLFSGCSLPSTTKLSNSPMANATVLKTVDGAVTWQPKIKVDATKTIAGIDVLSMALDPTDSNVIYLGTQANGLFVSKDGAETWTQAAFPEKVYGLVFDPSNHEVMYASGVLNGRAKIFKRLNEGEQWKEIYTEPADGAVISALAIDGVNSQILFAGTSEGVIVKTVDGGTTWTNLKKADGPVTSIVFDKAGDNHIFFLVFQLALLETKDGGKTLENITPKIDAVNRTTSVYSLVADPNAGGVFYVGTGSGIFRKNGAGDLWSQVNTIESSRAFAIRAIAINPANSKEIIYASSQAIYKSSDGGNTWATFQLDTAKEISVLKYDKSDVAKIYAGLRKF